MSYTIHSQKTHVNDETDLLFVAIDDQLGLVGSVRVADVDLDIPAVYKLFVNESSRSKGIGLLLAEEVIAWAKRRGKLAIRGNVARNNPQSYKWYKEKLGAREGWTDEKEIGLIIRLNDGDVKPIAGQLIESIVKPS